MADTAANMQKKIHGAESLKSVVRTMKAIAASSIIQYERSAIALDDYYYTVALGLGACLKQYTAGSILHDIRPAKSLQVPGVVIFGSDQGMVGQFNEVIAHHAIEELSSISGDTPPKIWAVGERIGEHLEEAGYSIAHLIAVPNSLRAITPLVSEILLSAETSRTSGEISELHVFYNHYARDNIFEPVSTRLLPLDDTWLREMTASRWPTKNPPEIMGDGNITLLSLIHEYLFVSIFRALADSLASENASRLSAMQRAEKNIGELLEELGRDFSNQRQNAIDEELFDVISGYETIKKPPGS